MIRLTHPWAPRGFILDTAAWAREWSGGHSVNRAQAPAVFSVRRAYPFLRQADRFDALGVTPEDILLAIDKAKYLSQYSGPIDLFAIAEARVCGPDGMVVAPDGRLLTELNDNQGVPGRNPIFRRRRFSRHPLRLDGNCLSLVQPLSGNYFHWLTESLAMLARMEPYIAGIDHVIVPQVLQSQQRESLLLAGIPAHRLVALPPGEIILCERLYGLTFRSGWLLSQQEMLWLRHTFLGQEPLRPESPDAGGRRIYVSRADATSRRVLNEPALMELLASYGFQSVRCSDLSCAEQAQCFYGADMIVSLHGAALTNLLFCRAGAHVLEIFPPRWSPLCFFGLSQLVGCRYSFLTATPSGRTAAEVAQECRHVPTSSEAQWSDVTVPLDRMKIYLDRVIHPQD